MLDRLTRDESADTEQVLQALTNGIRSDVEIAKTARITLNGVHIAFILLVAHKCVGGSPNTRFRTTDSGYDMIKTANAAERKLGLSGLILA
ncbi:MAG: hypothetical protein M3Z74_05560, partial [Pseudomonadota bacterium]|nr:hypothetical protein [Pseudomonadota bacterium]